MYGDWEIERELDNFGSDSSCSFFQSNENALFSAFTYFISAGLWFDWLLPLPFFCFFGIFTENLKIQWITPKFVFYHAEEHQRSWGSEDRLLPFLGPSLLRCSHPLETIFGTSIIIKNDERWILLDWIREYFILSRKFWFEINVVWKLSKLWTLGTLLSFNLASW